MKAKKDNMLTTNPIKAAIIGRFLFTFIHNKRTTITAIIIENITISTVPS
jgi:hypothetical protein